MALTFSDFRPVQAVFEVRYPEAFLLWDRAGKLARQFQATYSLSRLTSAEPGKVVFVEDRTREVIWQLDRLSVRDHQPGSPSLEEFFGLCEDCFRITTEALEVQELKRVGFRPVFAKGFTTLADAASALLATGILSVPESRQFNVAPLRTTPEYRIRREDEKLGCVLRLYAETIKYEFNPPPQWPQTEAVSREEHRIVFDIDLYTSAPMPVGAMGVKDWLSQGLHAIRRDADRHLGR